MCVGLLVFINLINYMDRFTISAVLPDIKKFYNIDDTESGMLNTSFILSFMVRGWGLLCRTILPIASVICREREGVSDRQTHTHTQRDRYWETARQISRIRQTRRDRRSQTDIQTQRVRRTQRDRGRNRGKATEGNQLSCSISGAGANFRLSRRSIQSNRYYECWHFVLGWNDTSWWVEFHEDRLFADDGNETTKT